MALIGAIIGDYIGSQYEYPINRPDDLDWKHCELFTDDCEFTDDTVMSIATKYALDNNISFARSYKNFGKMFYGYGYGDMFEKWLNDENSKPYGSYGNGSAMRVSYIGEIAHNVSDTFYLSLLSAECTHNSKDGILGAITTASVIAMCKLKYKKESIQEYISDMTDYDVSTPLSELQKTYVWNSTCRGTVPAAIICFLESTDYESCIRNCLSLSCDMDTMCCIAGGMAEEYYGTTGFDNKKILQEKMDPLLYSHIRDIL